jgi:hypothetical protein
MAMTISGSTGVTYPDGTSQVSGQQACKAWVNYNGQGTVAIRAAYNVTSITDLSTGQYLVNFTTALSDTNYATFVGGNNTGNADGSWGSVNSSGTGQQTSNVAIATFNYAGTYQDWSITSVSVFR